MIFRYFLFLTVIFIPGGIKAQTLIRNNIDIGLGINQIKEGNLHPKVHTGIMLQPSFSHRFKSHNISEYQVALGYSKIKTRLEELNASVNLQLIGSYRYLIKHTERNRFSMATGPGLNLRYNISYYPRWDDSHLYWSNQVNLSVENQMVYRFNEAKLLKGYLGFSLLSLFSRPIGDRQYKIDDLSFGGIAGNFHRFSGLATINKAIDFNTEMEYYNQVSPAKAHGVFYAYGYRKIQAVKSNPFQNSIHQIGFKHYFK